MVMQVKRRRIGTMHVTKPVFVGDPCYDKGEWLTKDFDMEHGAYACNVFVNDNLNYILQIVLKNEEAEKLVCEDAWKECGIIGVDSGMVGVFTDKPNYSGNNSSWLEFCDKMHDLNEKHCNRGAYILNETELHGFCAYTADGDGEYDIACIKSPKTGKVIAIEVYF